MLRLCFLALPALIVVVAQQHSLLYNDNRPYSFYFLHHPEPHLRFPTAKDLPFLKFASPQTQKDVFEVISESQLSIDEKEDIIADIVAKDTQRVQADFDKFRRKVQQQRTKKQKAMNDARKKMTNQAAAADEYIESVVKNGDLEPSEKQRIIRDIMNGLSEGVRKELYRVHDGLRKVMKRALGPLRRLKFAKSAAETGLEVRNISLTEDNAFIQF